MPNPSAVQGASLFSRHTNNDRTLLMQTAYSSLSRVIAQAVDAARQDGLDYVGQMERAMKAVRMVEPDLVPMTVRRVVERLWRD